MFPCSHPRRCDLRPASPWPPCLCGSLGLAAGMWPRPAAQRTHWHPTWSPVPARARSLAAPVTCLTLVPNSHGTRQPQYLPARAPRAWWSSTGHSAPGAEPQHLVSARGTAGPGHGDIGTLGVGDIGTRDMWTLGPRTLGPRDLRTSGPRTQGHHGSQGHQDLGHGDIGTWGVRDIGTQDTGAWGHRDPGT